MNTIIPSQRLSSVHDSIEDADPRPTHDSRGRLIPITHEPWCDAQEHDGLRRRDRIDIGCSSRTLRVIGADGRHVTAWAIEGADGPAVVLDLDRTASAQPWTVDDVARLASALGRLVATLTPRDGAA